MVELIGKKILVLGASGNIGRQVAIKLSKLGANVIISGRNIQKLDETFSMLEGKGHFSIVLDVLNLTEISTQLDLIVKRDGQKLSGLVYCAGVMPIRPLKNTDYSFLHNTMIVNYYGFVETVRCFSNKKISEKGSIVALSSYASQNGDKGQLAYAASKGAIDSSILIMAKELYQKGLRVNAIRPAIVNDDQFDIKNVSIGIQNTIEKMRTGLIDVNNLTDQIAFLISDYSSGVYGRCFDVRGYLS